MSNAIPSFKPTVSKTNQSLRHTQCVCCVRASVACAAHAYGVQLLHPKDQQVYRRSMHERMNVISEER